MEIITKFNKWDTAFLLENRECFRVTVREIDIAVAEEGVEIEYTVDKIIPKGLLKEEIIKVQRAEAKLFLSKQEVKDVLKEIEEADKEAKELNERFPKSGLTTSINWFWGSTWAVFTSGTTRGY